MEPGHSQNSIIENMSLLQAMVRHCGLSDDTKMSLDTIMNDCIGSSASFMNKLYAFKVAAVELENESLDSDSPKTMANVAQKLTPKISLARRFDPVTNRFKRLPRKIKQVDLLCPKEEPSDQIDAAAAAETVGNGGDDSNANASGNTAVGSAEDDAGIYPQEFPLDLSMKALKTVKKESDKM